MTIIKLKTSFLAGISGAIFLTALFLASSPTSACTIFVLTDTNRVLFCNNEDWSDSKTRIWFLPAGGGYYGGVYVGFDNGFAQGGMNTEGLAFDWVAGGVQTYAPDPRLPFARGNSSQRMLETSKTVEDAITFYKTHQEPAFSYAHILVADKTGASVIIGAKDGKLNVEPDKQCRGFGFGHKVLDMTLARHPQPTVSNGFKILHLCRQQGQFGTKYCNIYDLKNGDIFLDPFPGRDDEVKFNLSAELKKGSHYYDMPNIKEQMAQSPRPLLLNMKRFPIDEFKPIPDKEPNVTAHLRSIIKNAADGKSQPEDFTEEEWKEMFSIQDVVQSELKKLGDVKSMTLVDRSDENGRRSYRYRIECANAILLQHFVLDAHNKVASANAEVTEYKPGAHIVGNPATKITGIGVALDAQGTNLVIKAILPGSPAAFHKDIHVGDRIIVIAQEKGPAVPVDITQLTKILTSIRGLVGTTVRLTLVSSGDDDTKARIVKVVRAEFDTR